MLLLTIRNAAPLLLAIVIVSSWGCATSHHLEESRRVVLSVEAASAVRSVCADPAVADVSGYWLPTANDVAEVEARLPALLKSRWKPEEVPLMSRTDALPALRLDWFTRQYLGVVSGGRRAIYVNGFSPEYFGGESGNWFEHWRESFVAVCDGGWAFWGAVYDPEAERFIAFAWHLAA